MSGRIVVIMIVNVGLAYVAEVGAIGMATTGFVAGLWFSSWLRDLGVAT